MELSLTPCTTTDRYTVRPFCEFCMKWAASSVSVCGGRLKSGMERGSEDKRRANSGSDQSASKQEIRECKAEYVDLLKVVGVYVLRGRRAGGRLTCFCLILSLSLPNECSDGKFSIKAMQ